MSVDARTRMELILAVLDMVHPLINPLHRIVAEFAVVSLMCLRTVEPGGLSTLPPLRDQIEWFSYDRWDKVDPFWWLMRFQGIPKNISLDGSFDGYLADVIKISTPTLSDLYVSRYGRVFCSECGPFQPINKIIQHEWMSMSHSNFITPFFTENSTIRFMVKITPVKGTSQKIKLDVEINGTIHKNVYQLIVNAPATLYRFQTSTFSSSNCTIELFTPT